MRYENSRLYRSFNGFPKRVLMRFACLRPVLDVEPPRFYQSKFPAEPTPAQVHPKTYESDYLLSHCKAADAVLLKAHFVCKPTCLRHQLADIENPQRASSLKASPIESDDLAAEKAWPSIRNRQRILGGPQPLL